MCSRERCCAGGIPAKAVCVICRASPWLTRTKILPESLPDCALSSARIPAMVRRAREGWMDGYGWMDGGREGARGGRETCPIVPPHAREGGMEGGMEGEGRVKDGKRETRHGTPPHARCGLDAELPVLVVILIKRPHVTVAS